MIGEDNEALLGAHVINLAGGTGTISNVKGMFRIPAVIGDTIQFSHVGYKPHHLIVDSLMTIRRFEVRMSTQVLELASIMIYAEVKYRVPRRFRPQPVDIEGLTQQVTRKPIKPGSIRASRSPVAENGVPTLGAGIVIHGPFTYLTKAEKEKRKAAKTFLETEQTIEYSKFVNQPAVRDSLIAKYHLSEQALDQLIIDLNLKDSGIEELTSHKQMWFSLSHFIESKVGEVAVD